MQNLKSFTIRWDDLDPNRHVANTTFSVLMNDRRMSFLSENGFTQDKFDQLQIGPVILSEHFYYIKEVMPGSTVYIDIELLGNTSDGKYISFCHSLYNANGKMCAYSTMLFVWMDLKTRKVIVPPDELKQINNRLVKSDLYKVLNEEDIRPKIPVRTVDLMQV